MRVALSLGCPPSEVLGRVRPLDLALYAAWFARHPEDMAARVVARLATVLISRTDKRPVEPIDIAPELHTRRQVEARVAELAEAPGDKPRPDPVPSIFQAALDRRQEARHAAQSR